MTHDQHCETILDEYRQKQPLFERMKNLILKEIRAGLDENHVLIGQVATKRAARGKGYARDFLHWIANDLSARGKDGILYALDIRKSFYEEIGFTLLESEFVWERMHEGDPDGGKGIL